MTIIGHTEYSVNGVSAMISYAPLWATMKRQNITTYYLRNKGGEYNISSSTILRLQAGESVSTNTIDALCKLLKCSVSDIIEFQEEG